MRSRPITWSSGGGVQPTAIAVLIAQRRLPQPDLIVIADTGYEQQKIWDYMDEHVQPMLRKIGSRVEIAPHTLATVDMYSAKGTLLIPAFTKPKGKLPTYCSTEWKRRVVRRYMRAQGYGPEQPVVTWIGISMDEVTRMKDSDVAWQKYEYPLIETLPRTRAECVQLVLDAGLPQPPRSSCYMCPFHTQAEWDEMEPRDKANAVLMDEMIRVADPNVYLHVSRKPLRDNPRMQQTEDQAGVCDSGYCFV